VSESETLRVIGLVGQARSGKDSAARLLEANYGAMRIALADGVRGALRDLDGMTWEVSKTNAEGFRYPMLKLGTEAREELSSVDAASNHWISHALIKIRYMSKHHSVPHFRFVIPDIRFKQEVVGLGDQIVAWGGEFLLWKMEREGAGLVGAAAQHKSETELRQIDAGVVIRNNSRSRRRLSDGIARYVPPAWFDPE